MDAVGTGTAFGAGATSPTIYDVAARAGVSIATVSRVLNGRSQRPSASSARVLAAVEELGFVPNGAARSLSRGLKHVVGIAYGGTPATEDLVELEEESLLYTDSIVRGAEAGAQRRGYSLLLTGIGRDAGLPALEALSGTVDGLVLLDQVLDEGRVAPLARRMPVVLLAGSGRQPDAVTVRVDNAAAIRDVTTHLATAHGARSVAYLGGRAVSPDSVSRAEALVASAADLGLEVAPLDTWMGDWTSATAAAIVDRQVHGGAALPDAIVCANDQTAIGALSALSRAGRRVPGDVAVVGFDDIAVARHLSPPLTTVRQPARQLGAQAVEAIVDIIEGLEPVATDIVLPTQLVLRASCGCGARATDGRP